MALSNLLNMPVKILNMRHIGHRNIKDTQLVKVFTVLGYDIYIPQSYCLPMTIYQICAGETFVDKDFNT